MQQQRETIWKTIWKAIFKWSFYYVLFFLALCLLGTLIPMNEILFVLNIPLWFIVVPAIIFSGIALLILRQYDEEGKDRNIEKEN